MSTRTNVVALLTVCLAGTITITAAPGGKTGPIPVITMLADSQNDYPLRVGSDTEGAYFDTTKTIESEIQRYSTGSDWMLKTYYGVRTTASNRDVFFDLSEPASPDNPAPPDLGTGKVQANLFAKCRLVNIDMLALAAGASVDCPGLFRFQAPSGAWYRFSAQPENFPQVDRLRVTCISSDASGCKTWTITPSGTVLTGADPNPKGRHALLEINSNGEILANLGDYYLSFHITVMR